MEETLNHWLNSSFFKLFIPAWSFVYLLGSKADSWLVCGRYILGIQTNITLVLNWYLIFTLGSWPF
jgi:hypothetical protein